MYRYLCTEQVTKWITRFTRTSLVQKYWCTCLFCFWNYFRNDRVLPFFIFLSFFRIMVCEDFVLMIQGFGFMYLLWFLCCCRRREFGRGEEWNIDCGCGGTWACKWCISQHTCVGGEEDKEAGHSSQFSPVSGWMGHCQQALLGCKSCSLFYVIRLICSKCDGCSPDWFLI